MCIIIIAAKRTVAQLLWHTCWSLGLSRSSRKGNVCGLQPNNNNDWSTDRKACQAGCRHERNYWMTLSHCSKWPLRPVFPLSRVSPAAMRRWYTPDNGQMRRPKMIFSKYVNLSLGNSSFNSAALLGSFWLTGVSPSSQLSVLNIGV